MSCVTRQLNRMLSIFVSPLKSKRFGFDFGIDWPAKWFHCNQSPWTVSLRVQLWRKRIYWPRVDINSSSAWSTAISTATMIHFKMSTKVSPDLVLTSWGLFHFTFTSRAAKNYFLSHETKTLETTLRPQSHWKPFRSLLNDLPGSTEKTRWAFNSFSVLLSNRKRRGDQLKSTSGTAPIERDSNAWFFCFRYRLVGLFSLLSGQGFAKCTHTWLLRAQTSFCWLKLKTKSDQKK